MKKAAWLTMAFVCSFRIANASPVDCTTVLNTNVLSIGSCSLNGLLFSQFLVNSTPTGSSIFLSAVGTGVAGNSTNLGFQITTPAPPSDTLFEYAVSTLSGAPGIIGVDNLQNGAGGTVIGELVCGTPFVAGICPTGSVLANFANPPTNSAQFAPQPQVFILKDISLPISNSFISSFVNSVETPEPGAALFTAIALSTLIGALRISSRRR